MIAGIKRILCLVAILAVVAGCQPVGSAASKTEIGISVRMMFTGPAEVAEQFDLMATMNVDLVRVDFDWSAIEGHAGRYDWSYPDRMVRHARQRGMKVLALLTYTPGWARPSGTTSHHAPLDPAAFAYFATAAATRYSSDAVRAWEIWNEPNTSDYWQPAPDIDAYAQLFRSAASAIRGVQPAATVLTGGLTRGTDTPDGRRIAQTTFVDGLYRAGVAQLADGLAAHPYSFPSLPSAADGPVGGLADLPALHAVSERWGDGGKKIWITEFGAPTGSTRMSMTESEQAASLSEARDLVATWEWAGPLVFYELRDAGRDPADLEQNFGVVRADLSPKRAATALLR